jgi:glycosyltransferase involved in cell wall biosynthesis
MRILNAIHAQNTGGVDQVFRDYYEVLSSQGHDVALLVSDNEHANYNAKKIYKLKNTSQIFDFLRLLLIVISFKPDVILCHSNRVMKWMRILKFFSSAKSVAINHGISFKNSLNCQFIISINQKISDLVVAAGFDKNKSFVVSNVINVNQKYQKKVLKKPAVIGIYGRLEPRKGFDILIKAAAILANQGLDFRLKIGGFEAHKSYGWSNIHKIAEESNVADKCRFVGKVLNKKEFFEDVDIFCVPSREEPFGLVILEGFLFSTIVISSNTDGGKLLISDGEDGYLFENESAEDLANKIANIIKGSADYSELTYKSFLKLKKNFSFDSLAGQLNQTLTTIIRK